MPSIFISHASADRPFAQRLTQSLTQLGHTVWLDVGGIGIGDSIPQRVAQAIEHADYLVVVLSRHSAASSWSEQEWQAKYWDEVRSRRTLVLPALLEDCAIPFFLRPKRFADFRTDYTVGLAQLVLALHTDANAAIVNTYGDRSQCPTEVADPGWAAYSPIASPDPVWYADPMKYPSQLVEVHVDLDIPYLGKIAGVWKPDEREQDAAWELYIELATRIAVAELPPDEGLLREGLTSLHGIFSTTRRILTSYGPSIARPKRAGELSFGYLAISMLNGVLRPVLAKWHPLLLDYEYRRDVSVSPLQHEAAWERANELRCALNHTRGILIAYADLLARISRVPIAMPS